jgi:hypothetical protein
MIDLLISTTCQLKPAFQIELRAKCKAGHTYSNSFKPNADSVRSFHTCHLRKYCLKSQKTVIWTVKFYTIKTYCGWIIIYKPLENKIYQVQGEVGNLCCRIGELKFTTLLNNIDYLYTTINCQFCVIYIYIYIYIYMISPKKVDAPIFFQ